MTAMRKLHPYELTNENVNPLRAEAINRCEQSICKNCRRAVYLGPFFGYEPDLDSAADRSIWRHATSSYAACAAGIGSRTVFAEPGGFPVITLCGSARFLDKFAEFSALFSRQGNIVLSLSMVKKDTADQDEKLHDLLDRIHKGKIDMSHSIFVLNVGGYIGPSTRSEIDYAIATGKRVDYLEPVDA